MIILYIYIFFIAYIYSIKYKYIYKKIVVSVGNSFHNWGYIEEEKKECRSNIMCYIYNKTIKSSDGFLYNMNIKHIPQSNISQINLAWTIERLSIKKCMFDIGKGKSNKYQVAVDYRLFNSFNHISESYLSWLNIDDIIRDSKKNYYSINEFMKRNDFVYIQKQEYKNRNYYVKELMKRINIHSYGKDLNNKKWPKGFEKNKLYIYKKYKFCIAIENSIININPKDEYIFANDIDIDYVTEKLFDPLISGCIPIYFGPKSLYKFLPNNHSAIIIGEYRNVDELCNYLNRIKDDKNELEKYFDWIYNYSKEWYNNFKYKYKYDHCKLCEAVNEHRRKKINLKI